MVFRVGCHVSISGSVDLAFDRAKKLNCNTFQIFTKNPRGWSARQLNDNEVYSFRDQLNHKILFPVVSHISYLPNLASQSKEIYEKSINSFLLELERSLTLHIPYFIIHGGSYKGSAKEQGFETYVNSILKGVEITKGKVVILIENSSGSKNSITGVFPDIMRILNEVNDKKVVQVCFDTCHAFSAGYDLQNKKGVINTLEEMESLIGIENVAIIHANDSTGDLGSHRDNHEHIGLGKIGETGFKELVNHPLLSKKPWILETPVNEIRGDSDNIKYLKMLRNKELWD
ncbi:MAG: deoxyribonuclease IV [Asgard group archaeon]|nr:deoxyribonuclease IV [Asgard group archaeon]